MKFSDFPRIFGFLCAIWLFAGSPPPAGAAGTNQVRLAIGPFSAADGSPAVKEAVALLPDLLTARLSADDRFQLVERSRISELWNELNLTVNGLDSSTTMLKLGKVLLCDWFLTGSFVTTGTNTQIWITVVNTRDGVVKDLRLLPFHGGSLDDLAGQIATFLDQVQTGEPPRKFIALGRFLDRSTSATQEDWSWRLRALIENHFHGKGFSIVDNETVSPLFEEFQLQQAGFSESATNRVQFKIPFSLVDGMCKWVYDTNDELSVAIRIRQLGIGEQVIHLRSIPGAAMESNLLAAMDAQLAQTHTVSTEAAAQAEADLYQKEFREVTKDNILMPAVRHSNNGSAANFPQDRQALRAEALKESERAYLLNTNNLQARFIVAMIYFSETNDPALQDRGAQMLEELMTRTEGTNIFVARQAYSVLAYGYSDGEVDRKTFRRVILVKPRINTDPQFEKNYERQVFQITTNALALRLGQRPNDPATRLSLGYTLFNSEEDARARCQGRQILQELSTNADENISDLATGYLRSSNAPDNRPTNSTPALNVAYIPESPPLDPTVRWPDGTVVDSFPHQPFNVAWDDGWLISQGHALSFYNRQDGKTQVPCPGNQAITALAADDKFWWVGYDHAVVQLTKSGEVVKTWTQNDGLLTLGVSALCRSGHRLWIGFNGGLGCIDLSNGKFTGFQDDVNFTTNGSDNTNRFDIQVNAILQADDKSIWVNSINLLQRRDALTGQLIQAFPKTAFAVVNAGTNFFAGTGPYNRHTIVSCFDLTNQSWNDIMLSKDIGDNYLMSLGIGGQEVWAGGSTFGTNHYSLLTVVDMISSKVTHRYAFNLEMVDWVGVSGDDVWLLGTGLEFKSTKLYHFKKSAAALASFSRPPLEAEPLPPSPPPMTYVQARQSFLRAIFSNFLVPVRFAKETNGFAALQILHLKPNPAKGGNVLKWGVDGDYYFGFKFTIPPWADSDLKCFYALAKNPGQKDFTSHGSHFGILEEHEDLIGAKGLNGFDTFHRDDLHKYPQLHAKLSNSRTMNFMTVSRDHLQPGQTYAIWFSVEEENHPDIAFAITIDSARGAQEIGPLPIQ